jgi:hypothetical protein
MSYLNFVLLPEGAMLTLGLCELAPGGSCITQTRIDWPDKTGLDASIRLGLHAVDRSYSHMYLAVPGCNVSIRCATSSVWHFCIACLTGYPTHQ